MNRRTLSIAGTIAAVALLAALALPTFFRQVYIADDLGEFHLPLRKFYSDQLKAGAPFDWCPDLYCGFYLTGEGQAGGYHPLHYALYRWLPLPLAFNLECWLTYPATLLGSIALLRRRQLEMPAAILGAIAFTFGSFNLLHFVHPNAVAVVAHLPWLLLAIDILIHSATRRGRYLAVAAIALLTGSQWLLGYPQYILFSGFSVLCYLIVAVRSTETSHGGDPMQIETHERGRAMFLPIGGWVLGMAIGTLIGGLQILPTIEALRDSVRHDMHLADRGSLHPFNLLQLVAPYLFQHRVVGRNTHELGLYLGAVPLLLAIYAIAKRRDLKRYRDLFAAAIGLVVLGSLWAFGSFGPLGWLQENLPIVNRFRLPCRAIVIAQLGAAMLTGIGFTALLRQGIHSKRHSDSPPLRGWLWIPIAASSLVVLAGCLIWPEEVASLPCIVAGPCLFATAAVCLYFATRGAAWATLALVLLAAIDLGAYGMSYSVLNRTAAIDSFIATTDRPAGPTNSRVVLDALAGKQAAPGEGARRAGNRILLTGWQRADGYAGLEPARMLDYSDPRVQRLAGVGWTRGKNPVLDTTESATTNLAAAGQLDQLSNSAPAAPSRWTPIEDPMPRAWLATKVIVTRSPHQHLDRCTDEGVALVEQELILSGDLAGSIETVRDSPGLLIFRTICHGRELLVVNESFHRGWIASSNAASLRVLRANGDFLGVVVPPGEYEIRLEFRPNSLESGRFATRCGLGLLVVVIALACLPRISDPPPPASTILVTSR